MHFLAKYGNFDSDWFQRVLWSDESIFELCPDAPESCLHRSGEKFNPECISTSVKHGGCGIMVWGAFSSAGVGELIRCEQSITAKNTRKY